MACPNALTDNHSRRFPTEAANDTDGMKKSDQLKMSVRLQCKQLQRFLAMQFNLPELAERIGFTQRESRAGRRDATTSNTTFSKTIFRSDSFVIFFQIFRCFRFQSATTTRQQLTDDNCLADNYRVKPPQKVKFSVELRVRQQSPEETTYLTKKKAQTRKWILRSPLRDHSRTVKKTDLVPVHACTCDNVSQINNQQSTRTKANDSPGAGTRIGPGQLK